MYPAHTKNKATYIKIASMIIPAKYGLVKTIKTIIERPKITTSKIFILPVPF
jgi:hypothetical protein